MKTRMSFFADVFVAASFTTLMVGLCLSGMEAHALGFLFAFYATCAVLGQRGRGRHVVALLNHVHGKQLVVYLLALGFTALVLSGNSVWAMAVAFAGCAVRCIRAQGKSAEQIVLFPQHQAHRAA